MRHPAKLISLLSVVSYHLTGGGHESFYLVNFKTEDYNATSGISRQELIPRYSLSLGLVVVAATVRATKSFVPRETVFYFVSYYNTERAKKKYKILSNLV